MRETLKRLCLAFGPSGYEDEVRKIVESEIRGALPSDPELIFDPLGGIYLHIKNEGKPRLMINAHLDEVGFMVTGISERGELKFERVGGIDPISLSAKRVISERGVHGVITSKPIHLLDGDQRKKCPRVSEMYIDIGASTKTEALSLTDIGEYFTFDSDFMELGTDKVKARALDDRHGCTIMLEIIKRLSKKNKKSPYDLYFAFTTREEIGLSGAGCATELIRPDYAIVIESKAVLDLPHISEDKSVGTLGGGGLISYADGGCIMDRELTDALISVCEENNIKYQINRAVSGGNDTSQIQRSAFGTRVALISAPSRYIHSASSVISIHDMECITNALYAFVTKEK